MIKKTPTSYHCLINRILTLVLLVHCGVWCIPTASGQSTSSADYFAGGSFGYHMLFGEQKYEAQATGMSYQVHGGIIFGRLDVQIFYLGGSAEHEYTDSAGNYSIASDFTAYGGGVGYLMDGINVFAGLGQYSFDGIVKLDNTTIPNKGEQGSSLGGQLAIELTMNFFDYLQIFVSLTHHHIFNDLQIEQAAGGLRILI